MAIQEEILKPLGSITIDPIKVERDEFYVEGENGITRISMGDNFNSIFLPLVSDIIDYKGGRLDKIKLLTKGLKDRRIKEERGDTLIQTPDEIAGVIASMISKQPKGGAGDLLSNGYLNIFYFENNVDDFFVVFLFWDSLFRLWHCDCYEWLSIELHAGYQVWSPVE